MINITETNIAKGERYICLKELRASHWGLLWPFYLGGYSSVWTKCSIWLSIAKPGDSDQRVRVTVSIHIPSTNVHTDWTSNGPQCVVVFKINNTKRPHKTVAFHMILNSGWIMVVCFSVGRGTAVNCGTQRSRLPRRHAPVKIKEGRPFEVRRRWFNIYWFHWVFSSNMSHLRLCPQVWWVSECLYSRCPCSDSKWFACTWKGGWIELCNPKLALW